MNTYAYIHNEQKLSYAELIKKANILADYIQDRLKDDKTPIPVYGHKDPLMMVCFLACVKSGRAYCPIDTGVPLSRTNSILEAVNSKIILTTESLTVDNNGVLTKAEIEKIIATHEKEIDTSFYVKKEDIFYIIFTSGSTGIPKGVQITYDNLNHFLEWSIPLANCEKEGKTFINQAPFSFDLSVMDVYSALGSGGTIFALDKEVQKNYNELFMSLENSGAHVWVSTPSFADICLIDKKFNDQLMPKIETFLFCGEVLTNATAKKLYERFPNARVINTYGPTESTVAISDVLITQDIIENSIPLPIGKSKPGTFLKIIDTDGKEVKEGENGEIIIIGDTVGDGYFNNLENTQKAFFRYEIEDKEYAAYRTGDKGYLVDGMLYYCGRIDLQIKLNGYRIEIPDIEQNLMKVKKVLNAVVLPRYKDGKIKNLVAFVIYKDEISSSFKVGQEISKELKTLVPDYMVPKKYIFLDKMPTTNNGKADRKALTLKLE
ncbi:MAG: D-alanine--poly(phosphoribitol) ligase subunit DltA [Bacilli bacterium]